MKEKILALIPARMGSTRFPGKPLALILGMPMIGHVYERVRRCNLLSETVVCTCDQEIIDIGAQSYLDKRLEKEKNIDIYKNTLIIITMTTSRNQIFLI